MERIGTVVGKAVEVLRSTPSNSGGTRANEIVPIADTDQLPPLRSPEVDRLERLVGWTDSVAGMNTACQLSLLCPLSDASRSILHRRIHELERAIAPCRENSRDKLLGAISGMLGAFPMMQRLDRIAALGIAAAYLWTVRERPPWAIAKACELVRSAEANLSRGYCPTEPEFSHLVKECVAPYLDALRRARQLLHAEVLPAPKPKLSREEIEAKLGRKLGTPPASPLDYAAAAEATRERARDREPEESGSPAGFGPLQSRSKCASSAGSRR
jgi:hypothetical protein